MHTDHTFLKVNFNETMSLNLTNGKEMTPNIEYINLHITYVGCSELKIITKINKMFEN